MAAARLLLKRGAEHLDADRPYEAIRTLGRALRDLYKHESRHDVVRALYLCASAYERVGLLWAARGTLLHAASISANEWWTHSDVSMALATCCNRLKWVELQLGRVPHLLAWHQIDRGTRAQLAVQGYRADQLAAGEMDFDAILGILLLRSDVWQLKALEMLPDALDAMGLHAASLALTFALGDVDGIRADVGAQDDHQVEQLFKALSTQPAGRGLPEEPSLVTAQTLHLASIVLGCRIEVTTSNAPPCVELAESLLAALESLLSTSVLEGVAPRVPSVDIAVRRSEFGEVPFRFDAKDVGGLPSVEVRCASFAPHTLPVSEQRQLREGMFELVAHLLSRTFFFAEREELGRIFLDEQGMQRALNFTASFGPIANVLGNTPRTRLEDWTEAKNRRFPLGRTEEWDAEERRTRRLNAAAPQPALTPPERGEGEIPPELLEAGTVKHSEIAFESPIREVLWNRAHWRGVAYAAMSGRPPWMILFFENREPAAEIFTYLVRDLGNEDPRNRLRVTIVKGISKRNPHHYRVVIGPNPDISKAKFAMMMSRIQLMEPQADTNLQMFLAAYALAGRYYLGVASGTPETVSTSFLQPMSHAWLTKKQLIVRGAWDIGLNDLDVAGVSPDDDVIIPPERLHDAPVLQLIRWKESRSTSQRKKKRKRRRF